MHVSLKMVAEVGRLRRREQYRAVRQALARTAHDPRCRIVQYSLQANHLHLVLEPESKQGLARGMIAFKTSCARRLNRVLGRGGPVFADRYHAVYLTSPAQVRNVLCYVLNNWRRHGEHEGHVDWWVDPFSSADFFDGWKKREPRRPPWLGPDDIPPVAPASLWLLTTGWRRHGAIGEREVPRG